MGIDQVRKLLKQNENIRLEFKTAPFYSNINKAPQFTEGDVFTTIIPIGHSKGDKSEGINEGTSEGINKLYKYIQSHEGLRVKQFNIAMYIPAKTIERWITLLKSNKKIEYPGSKKTGGYYIVKNKD